MTVVGGSAMRPLLAAGPRGVGDRQFPDVEVASAFDLNELIRLLWRRKAIILGTVIALTVLAAVALFSLTPIYTATATVVLDPTLDPRQLSVTDIQSALSGLPADSETVQTEIQVLTSRELATKVVAQLGLDLKPEFNASLRPPPWYAQYNPIHLLPESWASYLRPPPSDGGLSADEMAQAQKAKILNTFFEHLSVTVAGESRALSIAFSSESPRIAALAANAVADLYVAGQLEGKLSATQKSNKWLNDQLSKLREQVEASQQAVEAYRNESGLLMGKDITVATQEMTDLSQQLALAQQRRTEAEARLQQATSASGGSISEVLNSALIASLREEQSRLTAEAAYISSQYGQKHPNMISLRSRIQEVERKIDDEIARVANGLRNEVTVAVAAEAALEQRLIRSKRDVARANKAQGRLQALQSEATANQTLFDSFLGRLKGTGGDDVFQEPDSHVVSRADIQNVPSFPPRMKLLLLVVAVSGFLGIVFAFIKELLDEGVRSSDQIEEQMNVRPLGLIPAQPRSRRKPEDDILQHRGSAFAEALRYLYTGMMLSTSQTLIRTVLITSTVPNEGKTTVAVALARLLAGAGKRVILVDCDLRRPRIHGIFGSVLQPGLANHLLGNVNLVEIVRRDSKSSVDFIAAGRDSFDSSTMFESERMQQLLLSLANSYELVILDSAPVHALSDARVLCRLVDKTVYLVRWAHTRRNAAMNGIRQLLEAGGDLTGVVLTRVNVKRHSQYGFADSGYYSGSMTNHYSREARG